MQTGDDRDDQAGSPSAAELAQAARAADLINNGSAPSRWRHSAELTRDIHVAANPSFRLPPPGERRPTWRSGFTQEPTVGESWQQATADYLRRTGQAE